MGNLRRPGLEHVHSEPEGAFTTPERYLLYPKHGHKLPGGSGMVPEVAVQVGVSSQQRLEPGTVDRESSAVHRGIRRTERISHHASGCAQYRSDVLTVQQQRSCDRKRDWRPKLLNPEV